MSDIIALRFRTFLNFLSLKSFQHNQYQIKQHPITMKHKAILTFIGFMIMCSHSLQYIKINKDVTAVRNGTIYGTQEFQCKQGDIYRRSPFEVVKMINGTKRYMSRFIMIDGKMWSISFQTGDVVDNVEQGI